MEEIAFEDRHVPKAEVDWERSWWWWYPLTRAIHPAIRITALLISAAGLWVLLQGLRLGNWMFQPRFADEYADRYVRSIANIPLAPLEGGQSQLFQTLGLNELAYLTFCLLWLTAVLGFFGGILSRRAAVELGQRTIAPWGETIRLVSSRMISYVWVTGMHLVTLAALLLIPFLLGLIARLGPMAYVAGALLMLLLPLALVVGRLVLSMFVCYPLAVTAISCEKNADAFEGFSRSNSYFFQRPIVTALCIFALIGIGTVGYWIIAWWLLAGWHWMRDAFLTGAGYTFTDLVAQPAAGPNAVSATDLQAGRITSWVLRGATITWMVIAAYWFSFFWSSAAAVYLILRRSVDNTDLDEIDSPFAGEAIPLPEIPSPPGSTTRPSRANTTSDLNATKGDAASSTSISSSPPDASS